MNRKRVGHFEIYRDIQKKIVQGRKKIDTRGRQEFFEMQQI